ncbi:protein phosphatase CheZ [Cognatilysobacter lacus]|uniref:Protein phosphatase CheZ n=1 Tax=Cognatilysobacter lacus TaxID=1643323 RepID=A0A5D8Z6V6_9GAMM|nr:protein phosphatase CheZ [Lysobacter lacus]TZF88414.1 protein phosphatase CheZ [Lysobacter lacus]
MSAALVEPDRAAIVATLQAAVRAVESDDTPGWRGAIDELVEWRTQPLVQGIVRLARELSVALGDDGRGNGAASLPDACSRLEHVVKLTETSSMRTLDLIDECSRLLGQLPAPQDDAQRAVIAGLRSRFSEMSVAQGYQDLTGQIILRVVELVRAVHTGLGDIVGPQEPLQLHNGNRGHGPAVSGVDPSPATQDNADELLSALGL